ncbi:PepSY-associated TM helix domain-containing protein [Marinimicrobium locisalis]|uniref:PepSY-associated TM helix domain-containing protein n=1 Tax=Marinimicrobium locisalis TaxID=546022 RepID=UPI00322170CC
MNQAIFPKTRSTNTKQWYRTIWRWHFYAGLFCIPFIITLALSGAIYLFKPQIDQWNERHFQNLSSVDTPAAPQTLIDAALNHLPGSTFQSLRLPKDIDDAVVVSTNKDGERFLTYVHPSNAEVLHQDGYDNQFIRQVRAFHGELLAGTTGSIFVELAACWAIVLILTGLYLWWPRSAKGLAGVFYPRLSKTGRAFWRDLHAVTGFWISLMALFLLLSGLPWSLVWGSAFKEVRQWAEGPVQQDWQVRSNEHQHHHLQGSTDRPSLDAKILNAAQALQLAPPVELSWDKGLWKADSQHQNRPLRATAWLDPQTGNVEERSGFSDKGTVDKVVGIGVAAHEGQLFGWFNQFLGVITALGLVALAASGFMLWRKRKPENALGAPSTLDQHKAKIVGVGVLVLGVFLPLVGISLVALWALEWSVIRRVKPLAVWLGVQSHT